MLDNEWAKEKIIGSFIINKGNLGFQILLTFQNMIFLYN